MNGWIAKKQRDRAEWIRRNGPLLPDFKSREWWRKEAIKSGTDWSSLLRQRLRVLAWVRAGRPPWAQFIRQMHK